MRQPGLVLRTALVAIGLLLPIAQPALAVDCSRTSVGHGTLPDLAASTYKGELGGLYVGTNEPPAAHADAGRRAASAIVPLDDGGRPSASGKAVVLSIGMSNTTQEFSAFVAVSKQDPMRSASVVVVDGAQGGQDARIWARADAPVWSVAEQRLRAAGVTAAQVQAVWLKQAVARPSGDLAGTARELTDLLASIVRNASDRYRALRQVFVSPRTYAGYATTRLNPEPYAFESGFAVRALVMGSVVAPDVRPWIGWGPYLWTDGTRGGSGGLVWTCEDVVADGTHPSASGQQKVARLLLAFFDTSPFTSWYRDAAEVAAATAQPSMPAAAVSPAAVAAPATSPDARIGGIDDAAAIRTVVLLALTLAALLLATLLLARLRTA